MQKVLVIDFGGQYIQLIARKVREQNVYCEILPYTASMERIKEFNPQAIILSGGSKSVYQKDAPTVDKQIFELDVPILGICYGMQYIAHALGGKTQSADISEYGKQDVMFQQATLSKGLSQKSICWMSHTDLVTKVPEGFCVVASTQNCPIAAMEDNVRKIYGVQFHPEVHHTDEGNKLLANFLFEVCKFNGDFSPKSFVAEAVENLKKTIGNKSVLCALSGGVDSAVAAAMIHKAVGNQLTCVFVDHGLMRKNEPQQIVEVFGNQQGFKLIAVDAESRFLKALKGVTDPETKRKIIGNEFIKVFEEQAKIIGEVDFLVQGTIYPDVIESCSTTGEVIKSHHNVGGLPDVVNFKQIVEPLRELFKDEVRNVGKELGLPDTIVNRQPFPGPGLGIRVIGEVTKEKLDILRDADLIFRNEIANHSLDTQIWQYFAVLCDSKTVGVTGDSRTYKYTLALRAVTSVDGMTADWAKIPFDVLESISNKICNEVNGVGRVVYDITAKPPATIEWE